MPDLERELRQLGAAVAFPPTPDLATPVRRRLAAAEPARRRFSLPRGLVVALAVLLVAVAAVMAVPQARTAILEWLGLRGVTIERVATSPTVTGTTPVQPAVEDLFLGRPVTLDEARRRLRYPLVPPPAGLGEPDAVYLSDAVSGGQVAFVYLDGDNEVGALFTQFRAAIEEDFIYKTAGPGTEIEPVTVAGEPGWWLEGKPHEFVYIDPESDEPRPETLRLARNTLLWQRGELTLRIEGDLSREEALGIAEGVE
jgi:hypothetical protein